jgi:hypothetical protein
MFRDDDLIEKSGSISYLAASLEVSTKSLMFSIEEYASSRSSLQLIEIISPSLS